MCLERNNDITDLVATHRATFVEVTAEQRAAAGAALLPCIYMPPPPLMLATVESMPDVHRPSAGALMCITLAYADGVEDAA